MLQSLYAKLSLSLIVLLITVGIFYTCLSFYSTSLYLKEMGQKLNADLAKNLVTDRHLIDKGRLNEKALSDTFMEYMVINPSIELYLLDEKGAILSYSAEPGKVKRHSVSLAPINAFLNGEQFPLLGDDPRSHDKQKVFSVTPIPDGNNVENYLYIVLHGEQYDHTEQLIKDSLLWKQSGIALLSSLLIGFVLGLLLFRKLTCRLYSLTKDVDRFCSGDFKEFYLTAKSGQTNDEIDQLGRSFTHMATRLMQQMDELKQQDALRRELVANVSHDLRTPIAILHGYLETLSLKATTMTLQEQEFYVQQALRSSEGLSFLIAQLFELAKLEAREAIPEKDHFNVTELVHDTVQKFQIKALDKDIKLALHVKDHAIFIHADIGLIARVLENLLGNALKFTPDKGRVDVSLSVKEDSIMIQIKDSGIGIAANELPNVFDRFYQGGNHREYQSGGLGLAIAKRIMELHGGNISVVSTPSKGSTFTLIFPYLKKAISE